MGFPEKILAVILQAFVEDAEDEDDDHRPYEAGHGGGGPEIEKNRFLVAAVELK